MLYDRERSDMNDSDQNSRKDFRKDVLLTPLTKQQDIMNKTTSLEFSKVKDG